MDTRAVHLLRGIRGCTDTQFEEACERVEAAVKHGGRQRVKWAVDLLREAAAKLEGHGYSGDVPLIADMKKCVEELD